MSNTVVDYLTVAFEEEMLPETETAGSELPVDVYERDVFDRSLRVFWIEKVSRGTEVYPTPEYQFFAKSARIGQPKIERYRVHLKPKEKITLQLGIYGKNNCTGGSLVLEYGSINDRSNSESVFYTRQLRVPFILTVRSALMAKNMDLLAFHSHNQDLATERLHERGFSEEELILDPFSEGLSDQAEDPSDISETCYLTFDVQNSGAVSFEIFWDIYDGDL